MFWLVLHSGREKCLPEGGYKKTKEAGGHVERLLKRRKHSLHNRTTVTITRALGREANARDKKKKKKHQQVQCTAIKNAHTVNHKSLSNFLVLCYTHHDLGCTSTSIRYHPHTDSHGFSIPVKTVWITGTSQLFKLICTHHKLLKPIRGYIGTDIRPSQSARADANH